MWNFLGRLLPLPLYLAICLAGFLVMGCAGGATRNSSGSGSPSPGPAISGVAAGSVTSTGAIITWQTSVPATSRVLYGTSSAYGSSTALDLTLVSGHQQTLSSLSPSTTYHYQVQSTDSAGNSSSSADQTFSTPASGPSSSTLTVSPGSLAFGLVPTGTSSLVWQVSVTNAGGASVTISQIAISGAGYALSGPGAPITLTPTQQIVLGVQFNPVVDGPANGSLSIVSNAVGSPSTVGLSGSAIAVPSGSVLLTWSASTTTVSGYNVYRSQTSGTGYSKINSSLVTALSYVDSGVARATTYFYLVTAVDPNGYESLPSSEVSVTSQ